MALTNEDLLAISQLLDVKLDSKLKAELQPLKDDIRDIKLHLENVTDKNVQLLAAEYESIAKRYEKAIPEMQVMQADNEFMKEVIRYYQSMRTQRKNS